MNRSADKMLDVTAQLNDLCAAVGLRLPQPQMLEGPQIPQPYQALLVHDHDMTPTMEAHWHSSLSLRVLHKRLTEHAMYRQVLMVRDDNQQVVTFGAIRINLDYFDLSVRDQILTCHKPLGGILAAQQVEHYGKPMGYFAVTPDEPMCKALDIHQPGLLYGRYNELCDRSDRLLAQVVEILPPMQS